MLKTCAEIAKLKKTTRQAANAFLARRGVKPAGMKGKRPTYDTGREPLASYLAGNTEKPPEPPPPKAGHTPPRVPAGPKPVSDARAAMQRISKPLNDLLTGRIPSGRKPSSEFYLKALTLAEKNQDAAMLFKLGQIADKEDRDELFQQQQIKTEAAKEQIAQEKAERLKIENEIRRSQYIDRETVKLIFGRVYAAHTSVLAPLSLKLASTINAIPPGESRQFTIKELIDAEIYSALETIKRVLAEFVSSGGEGKTD